MAQISFDLTYDGPRLQDGGAMPVSAVAPALEALAAVLREASLAAYPSREPAVLTLRGGEKGSLVLQLMLEAGWDHLVDIFSSEEAGALANVFQLVGGGWGLFALVKKLSGRRISEEVQSVDEPDTVRLILDGGEYVSVPRHVLDLYKNVAVRKRVRQVVEPLALDGVERVQFVRDTQVTILIEAHDLESFDPPPAVEEPVSDTLVEGMVVYIAAPSFTDANKWRLHDGGSTFAAAMDDAAYRSDVDSGRESFRAGDMLRVDMQIIQSRSDDVLHTERRIQRVIQHIPREMQLRFESLGEDETADDADSSQVRSTWNGPSTRQ